MTTSERIGPIELSKFLGERNADSPCPYCSTKTWKLLFESQGSRAVLLSFPGGQQTLSQSMASEVITLACSNCGNIRLIQKDTFDEWKAAQLGKGT